MEAMLMLFNFGAMAFIMVWGLGAARKGSAGERSGLLAFGVKPSERVAPKKSKYWRE